MLKIGRREIQADLLVNQFKGESGIDGNKIVWVKSNQIFDEKLYNHIRSVNRTQIQQFVLKIFQ